MSLFQGFGLGIVGFFVGNLLFARAVTVIGAAWQLAKDQTLSPRARNTQIALAAIIVFSLMAIPMVLKYRKDRGNAA